MVHQKYEIISFFCTAIKGKPRKFVSSTNHLLDYCHLLKDGERLLTIIIFPELLSLMQKVINL